MKKLMFKWGFPWICPDSIDVTHLSPPLCLQHLTKAWRSSCFTFFTFILIINRRVHHSRIISDSGLDIRDYLSLVTLFIRPLDINMVITYTFILAALVPSNGGSALYSPVAMVTHRQVSMCVPVSDPHCETRYNTPHSWSLVINRIMCYLPADTHR